MCLLMFVVFVRHLYFAGFPPVFEALIHTVATHWHLSEVEIPPAKVGDAISIFLGVEAGWPKIAMT